MNGYLKDLVEIAKFNDLVIQHRYRGSKKVTTKNHEIKIELKGDL